VGDGVLRTFWLSRLPTHVQPHLVIPANDTINQLADIADAIMEAIRVSPQRVTEVVPSTAPSVDAHINLQMQQRKLLDQITTLRKTIKTMQLSDRRDRHRSRSTNRGKTGTCWYHLTFGQAAQKCPATLKSRKTR